MVEPYKPLYTVKEASRILMIRPDDVRKYIKAGKLPALILGSTKIRGSDLERFIECYPAVTSIALTQPEAVQEKEETTKEGDNSDRSIE